MAPWQRVHRGLTIFQDRDWRPADSSPGPKCYHHVGLVLSWRRGLTAGWTRVVFTDQINQPNVGQTLAQRRRRWDNIWPTLVDESDPSQSESSGRAELQPAASGVISPAPCAIKSDGSRSLTSTCSHSEWLYKSGVNRLPGGFSNSRKFSVVNDIRILLLDRSETLNHTTVKYFWISHGDRRVFSIWNHH